MSLAKPDLLDLGSISIAIASLETAHNHLRGLGVRRAATLTAQALHSARSAERQIKQALGIDTQGDPPV